MKQIANLLQKAALASVDLQLSKYDNTPRLMSKAAAYRMYGRSDVDRWVAEGLIIPEGKLLDRNLLAQVAGSSNRITYLKCEER